MEAQSFMSRVDIQPNGCWNWQGRTNVEGYGALKHEGKQWLAHRFSFYVIGGRAITKPCLHHKCENKQCVCPDHLQEVTKKEHTDLTPTNPAYILSRLTHCKHGHEFTADNTYFRKVKGYTRRQCKRCNIDAVIRYKSRRSVAA